MSDFGTFLLDRGLFEHPFFAREPFTEREAWAWMIARAARTDGERRVGNLRIPLRRGQLAHSGRFLAQRWQWSHSRVQRFLARLVTESMIESVTESGITCVTIRNYDKYQLHDPAAGSPNGSGAGQRKEDSKPTDSESVGGDDSARVRARDSAISDQAWQLAVDVMKILDIDVDFIPPGWCGASMWFQAGLSCGWKPELVRVAAAKVRARRNYEPPYTFRYLGKPIQREHELAQNPPLPIPPVALHHQETSHAQHPSSDWRGRRDEQHAAYQEFRDAAGRAAERERDERGGHVIRMVPNARRP